MSNESFEVRIEELNRLIKESKNIVFFGGAGVSTDSGIPDFRSKDGLYNQRDVRFEKYSAEYLLSHSCLYLHPKVFYEFYRQKMDTRNVLPNVVHKTLADMEAAGKLSAIITQNIDGLHQKAGSKNVYEIHGTTLRNYCDTCNREYDVNYIFDNKEEIPRCSCGGMVRPDVTLYEEGLPDNAWSMSVLALKRADLFIIGGTSLTVYPANTLLKYYGGDKMVIINNQATEYDKYIDLIFREGLREVFEKIRY